MISAACAGTVLLSLLKSGGVAQCLVDIVIGAALLAQRPQRHNFRARCDARDADAVVAGGRDGAGHVGAVPRAVANRAVARIVRVRINVTIDAPSPPSSSHLRCPYRK